MTLRGRRLLASGIPTRVQSSALLHVYVDLKGQSITFGTGYAEVTHCDH